MHDPMVVLFDLRLPIPSVAWKATRHEPRWGVRAYRRTNPENLGEFVYEWWRPKSWQVFAGGRRIKWLHVATVWHNEPDNHDSGDVCGRHPRGWRLAPWTVRHIAHVSLQIVHLQRLRRWLFQRCAGCNGRHRRTMPVNVSGSWYGEKGRWWRSRSGLYHMTCSDLKHARSRLVEAQKALRDLAITKEQLIDAGWEWTDAWRVVYNANPEERRRG